MSRAPIWLRRYIRDVILALFVYALLLIASNLLLRSGIDSEGLRLIVALSPVLPFAIIAWIVWRALSQMDELFRKIQFDALLFAFAATAVITFGYGFLEGLGYPRLTMFLVWPLMSVLWILGLIVGRIRFRLGGEQ